jgi:hypothetical protein
MNGSVNSIFYPYRKENDIMKAKLHKLVGTAVLGLVLVSQSLPAWAGVAVRKEVYISPSGTDVQGTLTGARYSKDSTQYIGCSTYSFSYSNFSTTFCGAADKKGRTFFCTSTDPRLADAVKGMTDSSDLRVTAVFDGLGHYVCTELTVSNESIYLQ